MEDYSTAASMLQVMLKHGFMLIRELRAGAKQPAGLPVMDNPGGYSYIQQVVVDGGAGVSCVAVDPREELIWMGGGGGHVSSYYSAACEKYTSFQAHPQGYPVRDLCVHSEGVISLSPNALRMNVRRGPTRWMQTSEDFCDLYAMTLLGKTEHRLAVSGNQPSLLEIDINRNGQILRRVALEDTGYKILRHNPQFLCCADFAGKIDLRSKDNFQVVHHFDASSANMMIQDMAVLGNQLVTCGVSDHYGRQTNHMYLRVYDLRMFRPQLLQMLFPPVLLRFLESYTSRVVCVSTAGQFQVLDVGLLETASPVNSIDPGVLQYPISCFDVCPSSQGIVFGDEGGNLYLYGTGTDIHFHNFCSNTPEFADPVDTPPAMDVLDPINILSSIPMPIHTGPLLSDLPPNVTRFRYHVAQPLDPSILSSIKMVGSIGYAPNNGRLRRNECSYILNKHAVASFKQQDQSPSHESQIPLYYHKIDIKYNKLGIEDFDYNQYNNTCFAGLESSLPNCYSNDMLQVFYFLEPLRMMLTNHSCEREFCLACELAYLFHMLENAQGMPCQASNFLRAFRTIPEVSALGLLFNEDRFTGKFDLMFVILSCKQLIQGWTRFMFTQLHQETADERTGVSVITQLFSIPQKILHRPTALPDILVINCGLDSAAAMDLWARKGSVGPLDAQNQSVVIGRAGQGDNSSIQLINKKCRFGDKCNRRSCRFQHSDTPDPFMGVRGERDTGSSSPGQSWLPFKLNIAVRGDAGGVTVRETELHNADGINYELAAIVCVILHD
ncbi:PAB-dependent poly(A)-specific ribonuclease subunit 2-like, partial [Tropilaelaps mercedesae]